MAVRRMYMPMSNESTGERLPVRIEKDMKWSARGVASLRGQTLSGLVKNLLKEAINEEKENRPELLAEEILKLKQAEIKRPVAVRSPANESDRKHGKQKPHTRPAERRKTARKR